ncbi:MAG: hypothetical protein V3V67_09605 [Myxococcota bacterium]
MASPSSDTGAKFRRLGPDELARSLDSARPPLLLDVRRAAAFDEYPGIPGAVPFALDRDPLRLPILARDHPIVPY